MSYFSAFVMPEGEPEDGPDIASNSGWASWSEWVLSRADQYPEAAHLAQEGWLDGAEDLTGLEHDLEQLLHADGANPNLTGVTAQVLAALRSRPEGALGLIVTDGEGGEGDSEALDEHIGVTEDGETWFSETLYERLSEAAGANLVRKQVQVTRNGKTFLMWVRVRPNTATGADRHAAPGGVHGPDHVVSRALADPSRLSAADVTAFADHVGTLNKEQLRQLNLAFAQKIGGTKVKLAGRLLDHVRGRANSSGPSAPPSPSNPPVSPPPPATQAPPNYKGKLASADTLAAPPVVPNVTWLPAPDQHEKARLDAALGDVLGRAQSAGGLTPEVLAAVANGIDGATVGASAGYEPGTIELRSTAHGYVAVRTLKKKADGTVYAKNELFEIEKDQPGPDGKPINPDIPKGADMLANQVRALRQLGVSYIATYAAGDRRSAARGGYVGYKIWPKLGYDGSIEESQYRRLPSELKAHMGGSRSILKLYETEAGQDWWANNGSALNLKFDLADGSRSMRTLEAYLQGRRAKKAN